MLLTLQATRQGGESNGFYTAFLDVTFSFRDRKSGDVVHEGGKQGVKGVQLDYQALASMPTKRPTRMCATILCPQC
jgi:hypothetical protein